MGPFTDNQKIIMGVVAVVIVLILILVMTRSERLSVTKTPWKKSESFKIPWKKSENLFSGDLTPQQEAIYRKLSNSDPNDSRHARQEYLSNKSENPHLVRSLMYT